MTVAGNSLVAEFKRSARVACWSFGALRESVSALSYDSTVAATWALPRVGRGKQHAVRLAGPGQAAGLGHANQGTPLMPSGGIRVRVAPMSSESS